MDLKNDVDKLTIQERIEEMEKNGVKLSPEQIESIKYEAIGRGLTHQTNVLHAEDGAIVTTDFFDALLVTSVSRCNNGDFFIINPDVQPLYNIRNEYMGFRYYEKIRNLKKEKKRSKNVRRILSVISTISMFFIGYKAPFMIIIACIIALVSFGYMSLMIGLGEGR